MREKIKKSCLGFVCALCGALGAIGIVMMLDTVGLGLVEGAEVNIGLSIGVIWFFVILVLLLHIAIHELGHVVFGLCTGYRFISYRFFSFVIQRTKKGVRINRYSVPGTLGQALMEPPKLKDGRIPYIWYNLGGALFNFLLVGVSLAVNAMNDNYFVRTFFTMSILIGLFLGVSNIFPYSEKGMSDGCNILNLHRHPEKIKYFYMQLAMVAQLADGKQWTEMDPEDFKVDENQDKVDSFNLIAYLYRVNMAYANKEFDEARRQVEYLYCNKGNLNAIHQKVVQLEKLFLELIGENRRGTVDQLYTKEIQQFLKAMKYEVSTYRVQMAYEELYNQDDVAALKCYKEGMKRVAKAPYYGEATLEKSLLNFLKEKVEKQISAS
ncbi:MAG: hypothetical protein Q4F05_05775 [bacterium]|nr:hypothetical protein [bacterium]